MSQTIRNVVIIAGLALTALFFASQIRALEMLRNDGETVLLKLRPVDPRALMMGDYMALAYDWQALPPDADLPEKPSGIIVLDLDENRVGTFARIDDGSPLSEDQHKLKYIRLYNDDPEIGGKRFYFQEGTAEFFEDADYGIFKINQAGRAMLVGLADENFQMINPD